MLIRFSFYGNQFTYRTLFAHFLFHVLNWPSTAELKNRLGRQTKHICQYIRTAKFNHCTSFFQLLTTTTVKGRRVKDIRWGESHFQSPVWMVEDADISSSPAALPACLCASISLFMLLSTNTRRQLLSTPIVLESLWRSQGINSEWKLSSVKFSSSSSSSSHSSR